MLARLHVWLPFEVALIEGAEYQLYGFESDGYLVQFHIPSRSDLPRPAQASQVTIGDKPAFQANVLTIVFQKESFNRANSSPIDPPESLIKLALEYLIGRLRYVAKALQVKSVDFPRCQWRLQYLNDDGSELEESPGFIRARASLQFSLSFLACDPVLWDCMFSLPANFEPPAWHTLLLDARAALPHIGTAVVLAATALEVFIADLLNTLAKESAIPEQLWSWINDRDDDFFKQPTVSEQFDTLLKVLTGHSLKEDNVLWQAFVNLKNARNKFVHEGVARIGNSRSLVSQTDASALLGHADAIVAKIREWIPEKHQWPVFVSSPKIQFTVPLIPK
jgi:hypothetical protein